MHHTGRVPRHRSVLRRPLFGLGGTLVALLALLTAVPEPASGAPEPATAQAGTVPDREWRPSHPEHDWMGSTVAAHEGRVATTGTVATRVPQTPGFDVSGWQDSIDWKAAYAKGARFAYIKATEGTSYRDPSFNKNYTDSYKAGFIRGAYHFALPANSGGKAQADYFVAHGGGWSKDGKTLPPMVDIEYNPNGASCYGLSKSAMVSWISAFVKEVHTKTSRWATIYTTHSWWTACTGNTAAFSSNNPLFVARYASSAGTLPAGWPFYTFWQHADSGTFPGDQDYFNGPLSGLKNLANNA
jgi:GH25 family lysozyme M1 (1,4-beta-N-acetylmuramidase)